MGNAGGNTYTSTPQRASASGWAAELPHDPWACGYVSSETSLTSRMC